MKIVIEPATKDLFGLWQVKVEINNKKYTYFVDNHAYEKAMQLYNKGLQGKALAVINEYQEATS